ncbi:hypothetical protein OG413_08010 [Streptomyces sp. NBC_01433]|uniref:alpha/beta fold hydrolase n=1 Tax=Streptomyces sp. NBC_01433 TaxID=2903864 RepID=UPI002258822D|nr:hypothetical protein [Streptomyces sp. NBC_01433]MCX4675267.1 hypothetical protein [Streptomyces sp. NBC_01433]
MSGRPQGAEADALAAAGDVDGLVAFDVDGLVAFAFREWAAAGADEAVAAQVRSAVPGWITERAFRRDDPPAYARLAELAVPTVLMVGDLDRPPIIACNEQMAARIPACRLIRAPGVEHFPPLRAPALVTDTALAHFGSDVRRRRGLAPSPTTC